MATIKVSGGKFSCPSEITLIAGGEKFDLRKIQLGLDKPDPLPPLEFHTMLEFCDREITKAVLGPLQIEAPAVAPSMMRALVHAHYTEAKMKEDWVRFAALYAIPTREPQKPKRPKWGQRGRHRLRKTRLEARAINHLMNELRRRLQCPKPSSLLTMELNPPPVV